MLAAKLLVAGATNGTMVPTCTGTPEDLPSCETWMKMGPKIMPETEEHVREVAFRDEMMQLGDPGFPGWLKITVLAEMFCEVPTTLTSSVVCVIGMLSFDSLMIGAVFIFFWGREGRGGVFNNYYKRK